MAKTRSSQLKEELAGALRRHSGVTVLFHAAVAERMGLGLADHKCLDLLLRLGPMTAGELASKTGLTTGGITGVIDRLERAGYAIRAKDPNDRRRVIVQAVQDKALTDFGPVFESIARATSTMLNRYSVTELELLLEFLNRADKIVEEQTIALRKE